MTYGPFFLMDLVGLDVILAIERIYFKDSGDPRDEPPAALVAKVERGELGVKSGQGFYSYPDAECMRDDFLLGGSNAGAVPLAIHADRVVKVSVKP